MTAKMLGMKNGLWYNLKAANEESKLQWGQIWGA